MEHKITRPTGWLPRSFKKELLKTDENTGSKKCYIGITATTFKKRFRNHKKSFRNPSYANDIELS